MSDEVVSVSTVPEGRVVVTLDGREISVDMERLGVTINSTDRQIIDAIRPIIREEQGASLDDEYGEVSFAVRKALNTNTAYVYPKPVAG
jgi:hypothetical protein